MSRKGIPNKVSKKIEFICETCEKKWLDYLSRLSKKKFCSKRCSALSRVGELRERSIGNNWGSLRKITENLKEKLRLAHYGKRSENKSLSKRGNKNPNWKGGTSPKNKRIRRSAKFFKWRKLVFERDDYTCQECGKKGGNLHPDHIKQFAYYPKLRFKLTNGRTLCNKCHMKTNTWGFKKHKLPTEQK